MDIIIYASVYRLDEDFIPCDEIYLCRGKIYTAKDNVDVQAHMSRWENNTHDYLNTLDGDWCISIKAWDLSIPPDEQEPWCSFFDCGDSDWNRYWK